MFQEKTFYQKTTIGKIMVWRITQENDTLVYEWGYSDSNKWQRTEEKIKPIHEGTVAAKTAAEHASEVFERKIESRKKSGYYETEEEAKDATLDIDFDNMPNSFSPAKPIVSKPCENAKDPKKANKPNKAVKELIKEGRFWAQRKANGNRCYYIKSEKSSYFVSRKMKDVTKNFPGLKDEFDQLNLPPNTILDMEVTLGGGYDMDQYLALSAMSPNTKPERAEKIYEEWLNEHPEEKLQAIVFDVIFFDGIPVVHQPYKERYDLVSQKVSCFLDFRLDPKNTHEILPNRKGSIVIPHLFTDFQCGHDLMIKNKWEGLVIWDNEVAGTYTLNGKPKRLKGCYKWKLEKFADCFITDVYSQDGNDELVGGLVLAQYDEDGREICCGRVGTGLTKETRKEAWDWKDKVVLVKYTERMKVNDEGERCFQFPSIVNLRTDKSKDECLFEEDEQ